MMACLVSRRMFVQCTFYCNVWLDSMEQCNGFKIFQFSGSREVKPFFTQLIDLSSHFQLSRIIERMFRLAQRQLQSGSALPKSVRNRWMSSLSFEAFGEPSSILK